MLRRFVPKRTRQFTSSVPLLAGFRVANSEQLSTLADFGPQPKCFLASLVIHKAAWISACLAQPVENWNELFFLRPDTSAGGSLSHSESK
jgi:hypothetical protein